MKRIAGGVAAAIVLLAGGSGAIAQEPAFFKGKTITVYIGFGPGGTYDYFARALARHMGKHISGNPNVVASNMPGAGSFRAANFLFNTAPKDGTAIGIISQTMAIDERRGNPAVKYRASEFNWLGRMSPNTGVYIISSKSKGTTLSGAQNNEIPVASNGPGSPSDTYPRLMNALLGTKFKVVRGFQDSNGALLAVERGEVDGALTSWESMRTTRLDWLKNGLAKIFVQFALEREKDLADIPTLVDLASNDDDRKLLRFELSSGAIGRSFLAPPGLPPARVKELRDAFNLTTSDKELLSEIEQAKIAFDPLPWDKLTAIVNEVAKVDDKIVDRMRDILKE